MQKVEKESVQFWCAVDRIVEFFQFAEVTIFNLIQAPQGHLGFYEFPVLAVEVDELNEFQVVLQRPLRFVNTRSGVVLIMLFNLFRVAVYL